MEVLNVGHAMTDPQDAASWYPTSRNALNKQGCLLRLLVYLEPQDSQESHEKIELNKVRNELQGLEPPDGGRWVSTGPHQDVSWLTITFQRGRVPLWIKRDSGSEWQKADERATLLIYPGTRLHVASKGFFPLPCHGVTYPLMPEPYAQDTQAAPPRIAWVLHAPSEQCSLVHLPVYAQLTCQVNYTPEIERLLSSVDCEKERAISPGHATWYHRGKFEVRTKLPQPDEDLRSYKFNREALFPKTSEPI